MALSPLQGLVAIHSHIFSNMPGSSAALFRVENAAKVEPGFAFMFSSPGFDG